MLKDAIGNPIKRGWALQIDARRGTPEVPTYNKTPTRIVMTGERL